MKLLIPSVALIALSLASCWPSDRSTSTNTAPPPANRVEKTTNTQSTPYQSCVNLNTANAEELTALPGVGDVIAKRIIEYREHHGRFRRLEEIIIIEGFSERKYRAIAGLICID